MTDEIDVPKAVTIPAQPPFEFGIGTQGELNIGFSLGGIPTWIVIPAEEVKILEKGLENSRAIRDTLVVKPPSQGTH